MAIPRQEALNLRIFPTTAQVNERDHLVLGGCDAVELAARFGTPLYVFDEATLRGQCRAFKAEFGQRYPEVSVHYACKATITVGLARIFKEEGLGLDVVSLGEFAIARAAGYTPEGIVFHGNNKGPEELRQAMAWGIGRIALDNFHEIGLVEGIAAELGRRQQVLLRVSPNVDPHTHEKTTTGVLDSKFGIPITTGQAAEAVRQLKDSPHLELTGLHCHLGSPIFELEPYEAAIEVIFAFAAEMGRRHGLRMLEFSPGGGMAVQYVGPSPAPPISEYARVICAAVRREAARQGLPLPRLVLEPGRAIVGQAGVALYTVGASKEIDTPQLQRKYVALDGGMADNIRPAIYGSRYEAAAASHMTSGALEKVTLAGKYCESGDILVKDIELPRLAPGDLVAIPASGAYCIAMSSNYNAALKPAIVLVRDGQARLLRRRETFEDLLRCEVV